jgi:hypothetical protein
MRNRLIGNAAPRLTVVVDSIESAAVGGFALCPVCGEQLSWLQQHCACCHVGLHWSASVESDWRAVAEANADANHTARCSLSHMADKLVDANETIEMLRGELDHWQRYGCAVDSVPAFLRKQAGCEGCED